MASPHIQIAGLGTNVSGLIWESDRVLRIGRQQHLEVVLRDASVDRVHAEIKYHGLRWLLRDLSGDPKHPIRVNHQPIDRHVLQVDDVIQVGKVQLKVVQLQQETVDEVVHKSEAAKLAAEHEKAANPELLTAQQELLTRRLTTLAQTAEVRDLYPRDHPRRMADLALLVADELKLNDADKHQLRLGALLHDIGKSALDDKLLGKSAKLTTEEYTLVKAHATLGAGMVEAMSHLAPVGPIVRHHHERWDGDGYPDALAGDKIPLAARIIAVVDSFEAMTWRRPHRPAHGVAQAFVELIRQAGTQFDPACVYAFLRLRPQIEAMLEGTLPPRS